MSKKIYYEYNKSNKDTILFLHGLSGDHTSFKHQIKYFKKKYSTLAIDLRGHGKSFKPENYELEEMLRDVQQVLNECGVKNPIIIGFSLGGYLAIHLASRIKTKKIILINPALGREMIKKTFYLQTWIARFVPNIILKIFTKSKDLSEYYNNLELYAKLLLKTPLRISKKIMKNHKSINEIKTKKKFYMIQSTNDEILKYDLIKENFDYEVKKIKGYHYIIAQKPKKVNKIIKKFLEQ